MTSAREHSSRPARHEDEAFLRELFYQVRAPEFVAAGLPKEQLDALLAQQYHAMRSYYSQEFPETEYSILEMDGGPIGYEALRTTSELHLIDIALLAEYRNQGIGTQRMRRLQEHAVELGMSIILSVEIFNPARHLYERLGFTVLEEAGIYQRMGWSPP